MGVYAGQNAFLYMLNENGEIQMDVEGLAGQS